MIELRIWTGGNLGEIVEKVESCWVLLGFVRSCVLQFPRYSPHLGDKQLSGLGENRLQIVDLQPCGKYGATWT